MLKEMLRGLGLAVGALAALKAAVVWAEPRVVFRPVKGLTVRPDRYDVPYREHRVSTSDGEVLVVWEMTRSNPVAQILFFHGNGGNLSLWMELFKLLHRQGFSVAALDYRGYGESSGAPSEQGVYRDVEAFLDLYWNRLHQPGPPVVYWGRSLGGPISAYAVQLQEPDGLILESTFASKDALMNEFPLFKALSPFSRYRFPTVDYLGRRSCPVLVLHGARDEVIPLDQGELLYDKIDGDKTLHVLERASHNDTQSVDPHRYWEGVLGFVARLSRDDDQDRPR